MARDNRLKVKAVVTQPDRRQGRGQELQSPPVAELARELDLPLFQPEDVNEDGLARFRQFDELDLGMVIAYGQILSPNVLDLPVEGFFNFHASLLPRWRGAAPIRHALLNGDEETGISIFRMEPELDAGPVCERISLPIRPDETYGSLYERLSQVNVGALRLFLSDLELERLKFEAQEGESTYAPRIQSEDAKIDWSRTSEDVERFVRAFNPDPGAYSCLKGNRLKVFRVGDAGSGIKTGKPGEILSVTRKEVQVQTGDGIVSLEEVQPAGTQRMSIVEYLAGNPGIEAGDRFVGVEDELG